MAIPRSQQINLNSTPYYHCMTQCVRRTFLCGKDKETGRDFSHRKEWIVNRLKELTNIFAINIAAYAVLSNHYHLVLHVDENAAASWSVQELKSRWAALFPRDAEKLELLEKNGAPENIIDEKLTLWRERLTSISWFMRCLNEPIAKQSNLEDEITGRFWEGRFKSQALLDEAALLSAMVYVDLNPIRAGISLTPESSDFTSIYDRIKAVSQQKLPTEFTAETNVTTSADNISTICNSKNLQQPSYLLPIEPINHQNESNIDISIDLKLTDYIELVDFTGRHIRDDKKGFIPDSLTPILDRLQLTSNGWLQMAKHIEDNFMYAVGSEEKLNDFNKENRLRKIRGRDKIREFYTS